MTSRLCAYLLSLFCCRLIIIILNPNPSPSLSTLSYYNMYLLLSNFFEGQFDWIFLFSNHILLPTFSSWGFLLFLSNCFFILLYASSIAFVACSQLFCIPIRNFSTHGISIWTIRSPFQGCLLKFNLNGIFPVATYFLSLYWNSAAANQSVQLSCW